MYYHFVSRKFDIYTCNSRVVVSHNNIFRFGLWRLSNVYSCTH